MNGLFILMNTFKSLDKTHKDFLVFQFSVLSEMSIKLSYLYFCIPQRHFCCNKFIIYKNSIYQNGLDDIDKDFFLQKSTSKNVSINSSTYTK